MWPDHFNLRDRFKGNNNHVPCPHKSCIWVFIQGYKKKKSREVETPKFSSIDDQALKNKIYPYNKILLVYSEAQNPLQQRKHTVPWRLLVLRQRFWQYEHLWPKGPAEHWGSRGVGTVLMAPMAPSDTGPDTERDILSFNSKELLGWLKFWDTSDSKLWILLLLTGWRNVSNFVITIPTSGVIKCHTTFLWSLPVATDLTGRTLWSAVTWYSKETEVWLSLWKIQFWGSPTWQFG